MGLTARRTGPVFTKSQLPPGGSPSLDETYETWATKFTLDEHDRWTDACFILHLFPTQLFERYELDRHLYEVLGPGMLFEEFHLTHHHRQRWLGIYLHEHKAEMVKAAQAFSAKRRGRQEEEINSR